MPRIPIAVQLYSVRDDCERDLPGVLSAVGKMGYAGVEFWKFHDYPARDIRALLDDSGLVACSTHVPIGDLLGEKLHRTVEFHQAIGNSNLVVPWLPEEYRDSASAWRRTGALFGELAGRLKSLGMRLGYHNHDMEYRLTESGELPFNLVFDSAGPDVMVQVDTGNAMGGGGDPVACLERYPGRSRTVHLKEYSGDMKSLIGEGLVPWDAVFRACETTGGTEWYIVEQETYAFPPMECIRRNLDNLRRMGK